MKRFVAGFLLCLLAFSSEVLAEEGKTGLPDRVERVNISGTIEGDFYWSAHGDVAEAASNSTSDVFVSTVELGVETDFTDWMDGNLVFLAEDLGTDEETDVIVDEAALSLVKENVPAYLVLGKRAQPFGVFENHLVSDPMTQDAYEINRPGLTVGLKGTLGFDISITAYRGEELMEHFFESGLFEAESIGRRPHGESNDVSSYIVSVSFEPVEKVLKVFGSFVSEPGSNRRNDTAGVGFSLVLDGERGVRLDAEYMKAVRRERYEGFDREFREGALSITAACEFMMKEREIIGGALFAERRAHRLSEPLEVAMRYEYFDDDGLA